MSDRGGRQRHDAGLLRHPTSLAVAGWQALAHHAWLRLGVPNMFWRGPLTCPHRDGMRATAATLLAAGNVRLGRLLLIASSPRDALDIVLRYLGDGGGLVIVQGPRGAGLLLGPLGGCHARLAWALRRLLGLLVAARQDRGRGCDNDKIG